MKLSSTKASWNKGLVATLFVITSAAGFAQGPSDVSSSIAAPEPAIMSTTEVAPAPEPGLVASVGTVKTGANSLKVFGPRRNDIAATFAIHGLYTRQFTVDNEDRNTTGWSVMPAVNFGSHLGLQADFVSVYTRDVYPGINRFAALAGPRFTFSQHWKVTPWIFGEGGETRVTYGHSPTPHANAGWYPTADAGFGVDVKVSKNIALQLIPAEYNGEWTGYDKVQHSVRARAGIVFYLRK